MKAKYFDFTGTIVYSIIPDPVPNIYQTRPKIIIINHGDVWGSYIWYGLAEEDK